MCSPGSLYSTGPLSFYLRKLQIDEAIAESEQIVAGLYEQYGSSDERNFARR